MEISSKIDKVSMDIKRNAKYMKEELGARVSFDVDFRSIMILQTEVQIYYVNGLVDDITVTQILRGLVQVNDNETETDKADEIIKNRIVNLQVKPSEDLVELSDELLSGLIIIFVDGVKHGYIVDVRNYPGRNPEEPDTERVIRGSRDGYTENIIENTALTRRRIKDKHLRNEIYTVGTRSKTNICISYIKDIANDDLVNLLKNKIKEIDIDSLVMADKALEEIIFEQKWNPYPAVRYTERPDVAAHHIMSGYVIIMVDTSPTVMIVPTTFFDQLEHAEEFRQTPAVGTATRWVRILAVMASLYLLPVWLLFVLEPSLLPKSLSFIGPEKIGNIPISLQIIFGVIGVEFLRMAAVHTPTPLATALGLIAAVLIGDIAISVGMISPEVILYVAISTIGFYVTPSYELSVANKIIHVFLLLMVMFFGVTGFMLGFTISILYLVNLNILKTPYLWPFIPFNFMAMLRFVLRIPVPYLNQRPSIVHPKDKIRMNIKSE